MIDSTEEQESNSFTWAEWDWWPLARLLITAAFFGAVGHFRYGWTISPRACLLSLCGAGELFLVFAFFSAALAYLFAWIPLLLLYAVILLNDLFYDLSRWVLKNIFRIGPKLGLNFAALAGEILLFAGLAVLLRRLIDLL